MRDAEVFDKIDLHLIRLLWTVLTERSVSRAAVRLGMHQPAVSAALRRLRALCGDPLLVRSGTSMVPTDTALRLIEPCEDILRAADVLFGHARNFDPTSARHTFRAWWPTSGRRHRAARSRSIRGRPRRIARAAWRRANWTWSSATGPTRRATCTWGRCLPTRWCAWCPSGIRRCGVAGRSPHFGTIPDMVASSLLVLTTGRRYCVLFCSSPARHHRSLSDRLSADESLPALARTQPPVGRRCVAARTHPPGGVRTVLNRLPLTA